MIKLLRILAELLDKAPENPVWRYSAPWKLGWGAKLFVVVQFVAGLAVLGVVVAARSVTPWSRPLEDGILIVFALALSPLVMAWNLHLLRSPFADPSQLPELVMTRLSPRELAFGMHFWPAAISLLLPVCLLAAMATFFAREVSGDTEEVIIATLALVGLGVAVLSSMLTIQKLWLVMGRLRMGLMLAAPVVTVLVGAVFVAPVFPLAEMLNDLMRDDQEYAFALLILPMWLVILRQFGLIGLRFVPAWVLRPAFPEVHREASVYGNSQAGVRDRDTRRLVRPALRAVSRQVRRPAGRACLLTAMVFALITLVVAGARSAMPMAGVELPAPLGVALGPVVKIQFATFFGPALWLMLVTPLTLWGVRRALGGVPLVSGGLEFSLIRALFWPHVLFGVFLIFSLMISGVSFLYYLLTSLPAMLLVFVVGVLASLMVAMLMVTPGKWQRARVAGAWALPVLAVALRYGWGSLDGGWGIRYFGDASPSVFIPMTMLGAGFVLLHNPEIAQALYDRVLRGAAPGEVRMAWPREKRE